MKVAMAREQMADETHIASGSAEEYTRSMTRMSQQVLFGRFLTATAVCADPDSWKLDRKLGQ